MKTRKRRFPVWPHGGYCSGLGVLVVNRPRGKPDRLAVVFRIEGGESVCPMGKRARDRLFPEAANVCHVVLRFGMLFYNAPHPRQPPVTVIPPLRAREGEF